MIDLFLDSLKTNLIQYDSLLQENLSRIINYYSQSDKLSEEEKKATQISFWRQIGSKDMAPSIELLEDGQIEEIESAINSFEVFNEWEKCIDYELVNKLESNFSDAEISPFWNKIEIVFIQWFVKNWYQVNGHMIDNIQYVIIENNSVREFDLHGFNFTDCYFDFKRPKKVAPYYNFLLSDYELEQRVLLDFIDHTHHQKLIRVLEKGNIKIRIEYQKCELEVFEIEDSNERSILFKKLKEGLDPITNRVDFKRIIVKLVDDYIFEGYREVKTK